MKNRRDSSLAAAYIAHKLTHSLTHSLNLSFSFSLSQRRQLAQRARSTFLTPGIGLGADRVRWAVGARIVVSSSSEAAVYRRARISSRLILSLSLVVFHATTARETPPSTVSRSVGIRIVPFFRVWCCPPLETIVLSSLFPPFVRKMAIQLELWRSRRS